MKVNSVQSLLGIWVAVLGLSSCAVSRRGAYDMRPENRAALYQERKASPYYRMDNEHTFPIYKAPYTVNQQEGQVLFGRGAYELYRTKDATYVTATYRCPEDWWFFNFHYRQQERRPLHVARSGVLSYGYMFLDKGQQGQVCSFRIGFPSASQESEDRGFLYTFR